MRNSCRSRYSLNRSRALRSSCAICGQRMDVLTLAQIVVITRQYTTLLAAKDWPGTSNRFYYDWVSTQRYRVMRKLIKDEINIMSTLVADQIWIVSSSTLVRSVRKKIYTKRLFSNILKIEARKRLAISSQMPFGPRSLCQQCRRLV